MDGERKPTLTEATVRELARSKSYERGQSYYEQRAVSDVIRRDETLQAEVMGSQYQPYRVTIEFDDAGIARTDCSCPYDHGGICKHRVAVLLTYIRDPGRISHEQAITEVIADADPDTLQDLLVGLVDSRPEIAELIESRLGTTQDRTAAAAQVSVNLDSIRRQASHALPNPGQRGHGDAYAEAERMAEELDVLIEQARRAIEVDDGETALEVLEAITEAIVAGRWAELLPHDVPSVYEVLGDLSETFTEAILTADLTESEQDDWEQRLTEWDDQLMYFMGESTLAAAADAAGQGWDDERVQQAMQGVLGENEFWDEDERWYEEDIIAARLAVLERRGRTEEYLNLAQAAGQSLAYARMLVQDGRIEEAVEYGIERLSTPGALLELAKTLREHDRTQAALTVAEHGLTIEGFQQDALAEWLRDRAVSVGDTELALEAAVTAFETNPSLRTYQAVEETAGDNWEPIRAELLEFLRTQDPGRRRAGRVVEVFLHEELYDEAIECADRVGHASVVEPVVDAVLEVRPQWAISACKAQAEPIIENGQHDRYRTAVRWLERAGQAAQAADELDEWRAYVEDLRDEHYRKYKLRPMLDELLEEL
ncbi:SWIM zinc finger family protein [Haladaptatus sp. NG-WS-4]